MEWKFPNQNIIYPVAFPNIGEQGGFKIETFLWGNELIVSLSREGEVFNAALDMSEEIYRGYSKARGLANYKQKWSKKHDENK